ncbi:MAG TPA: hypothetical protein VN702_08165 [Acetobacteraceae bacterium]|nr:hypothetical protein [Acetobacteraceae bacterium]
MVEAAVLVLSAAVAAGIILALWHMRAAEGASRPPFAAGLAHGAVGIGGLVILALSLRGPPRGVAYGAGSFGWMATVVIFVALLFGLFLPIAAWRGRRVPVVTVSVHAGLAITGYVLLLAWSSFG